MPTSRTISGIICLCATCSPLVLAPLQLDRSLTFVREMENRTPNPFPMLESGRDLVDSSWWARVSDAFEDRIPYRKEMISLEHALNLTRSSGLASKQIAFGVDQWLFWYNALAHDFGSYEDVQRAIAAMDEFMANNTFSADLFILAAPDKATIYPEKLTAKSRAIFEPSVAQRELLHSWFAQPDGVDRLDIWTKMLHRKDELDERIYEPGGSHFNSLGAMVMARAMVDAVDPTLWDDDELVEIWTKTAPPELALRGGEWGRSETHTRSQIRRDGVEIKELWDADEPLADPDFLSIEEIAYHDVKRVVSESATRPLIAGKTLVIHDSFIAVYLYPTLSQFFEDITFIHVGYISPLDFREALNTYDRVYFQSAEHYFPERAIEYFEQAGPTTP
jgi:SGNH hydrolase-like domain, acetyltransferase AlgX